MGRSLLPLCGFLACTPVFALTYMPDANLRAWAESSFPGAISGEYIDETNPGVMAATDLNCSNMGIHDPYGLSAFANATGLDMSNNPINYLADLPYGLQYLNVGNCAFTGTFQAPYAVVDLNVGDNQITTLDLSVCSQLQMLYCAHNQLTSIIAPWSPVSLWYLDCSYNQLSNYTGIPLCPNINVLSHNLFTTLPGNLPMSSLDVSYNQIMDLGDVYGQPYGFILDASHNLIEHAGYLENIDQLDLSFNPLAQGIDHLPYELHTLRVTNTQMGCLPYLNHSLQHLYSTGNTFTCLPNQPVTLIMSQAEMGFPPQICDNSSPCYAPLPSVAMRVFLQGPFDTITGFMHDDLRAAGLIPTTEPYTALGFNYAGVGWPDTLDPAIFDVTGNDAIVDWVVVDLYPAIDLLDGHGNAEHYSRPALVQRDGDVVGLDGSSPLVLNMPYGPYHAGVRHRNHLGAFSRFSHPFGASTTAIDFTNWLSTACWGEAMHGDSLFDTNRQLWCGNVNFDLKLRYIGANNDRDPILQAIGGSVPNLVVSGVYSNADVNMDGKVKYVGGHNDRDPILVNIGGVAPAAVRNEYGW